MSRLEKGQVLLPPKLHRGRPPPTPEPERMQSLPCRSWKQFLSQPVENITLVWLLKNIMHMKKAVTCLIS